MPLTCYHCKKEVIPPLTAGPIRIAMREVCPHCSSDAHVCLNCTLYDPGSYHECRESQAEYVAKKDRNNLCEYFKPSTGGPGAVEEDRAKNLSALDDLFKK